MTPDDVIVFTCDGFVHRVKARIAITIFQGKPPHRPWTHFGTRYTCGCGLTVDKVDSELSNDVRFVQGLTPNCANCS